MTLILSNEEIDALLPMEDCLERLEETYREAANLRTQNRPRSDLYGPIHDNGRYIFKTMDGIIPLYEVAAIRLNSDVMAWNADAGGIRKEKLPVAPGGKWVGLILLFSTRTGEPLAIMPDGVIQRLRVAAVNALAAKYMAPSKATAYALIGSGWQASGQALAMACVRSLTEIRIYSPTQKNREKLAAELRETLQIDVRAFDDARTVVRDADIVGMATNSVIPVIEFDWLAPHAHVTCVRPIEPGPEVLEKSSRVVVHARLDRPANYIVGESENAIFAHDPREGLSDELNKARSSIRASAVDLSKQPDLADLVAGKVADAPPGTLTTFVNTIGLGIQFAALGSLALQRANKAGVGREIPTDWFLETVHP